MIGIEARRSLLLDKQGLEGIPDQDGIVLTIPDEHLNIMRYISLESSSSSFCLNLSPLQLLLIQGDRFGDHLALGILNFRFGSWFLLLARDKTPQTIKLKPGLHIISPEAIICACERGNG
jgi:hypothetical protein